MGKINKIQEQLNIAYGDPMITITVNDPDGESGEFIVNI